MASDHVTRPSGRKPGEMRAIDFQVGFTSHAAGSVLASFGNTRVLCTASVSESVPSFLRGRGQGWLTANMECFPDLPTTELIERQPAVSSPGEPLRFSA